MQVQYRDDRARAGGSADVPQDAERLLLESQVRIVIIIIIIIIVVVMIIIIVIIVIIVIVIIIPR